MVDRERSRISIAVPGEADEYWLEMDVTPYIRPPLLPRRRLDVLIGGTLMHSFAALPVARWDVVPCYLVAGEPVVDARLRRSRSDIMHQKGDTL